MNPQYDLNGLLEILACPACKESRWKVPGDDQLVCVSCGAAYPIDKGIPIMLKDREDRGLADLAKLNEEDMIAFRGESAYVQDGHDQHLLKGINPQPGELILDLGCGPGLVSKWVAQSSMAKVVSYDLLLSSLRFVENRYVICGSADNIALKSDTFDKVIFTDVLEHIPPSMEGRVISEIYRVLKPGGMVYLDYPGSKLPYYSGYPMINVFIAVARLFGSTRKYYVLRNTTPAHLNESFPHRINGLFAKHGFVGKAKPRTTKFFSIPPKYRRMAGITNLFPLNYLFAKQMIGRFTKPGANPPFNNGHRASV